jgi:hypothetical protein
VKGREIDNLLEAYLRPDDDAPPADGGAPPQAPIARPEADTSPRAPSAEADAQAPTAEPGARTPMASRAPIAGPDTPPRAPAAGGGTPQAPPAKADLRELLARYLDTFPGDGDEAKREFALPRSAEVDELLRRQVVDNEHVEHELVGSLRAHLEAVPRDERHAPEPDASSWAQVAASTQHALSSLDERLERYAHAYAELDEQAHTFGSADDSTIKGIPPPNSPPIPLGSPMAKQLKSQIPPRDPKKER